MSKRSFGLYLFVFAMLPVAVAQKMPTWCCDSAKIISLNGYEKRVCRVHRSWESLIPRQAVVQFAGNMGLASIGVGWNYGRHDRWETQILFGYIPKYSSSRAKMTMTLKENFIPWQLYFGHRGCSIEPLTCGVYVNTVFGHEFWRSQPGRYPKGYYRFLSTRIRANVCLGQRLTYDIPERHRHFARSVTAFYEVSTCDLYVRAMFQDRSVRLGDVIGLSLGLKLQLF